MQELILYGPCRHCWSYVGFADGDTLLRQDSAYSGSNLPNDFLLSHLKQERPVSAAV